MPKLITWIGTINIRCDYCGQYQCCCPEPSYDPEPEYLPDEPDDSYFPPED